MKVRGSTHAKRLLKKAKRGFRGYPVATVAFYGPDDRIASKVAAGIIAGEHQDPQFLERWFSEGIDGIIPLTHVNESSGFHRMSTPGLGVDILNLGSLLTVG